MKTLLHIIATPRGNLSNTLKVSAAVVKSFQEQHPDGRVDAIDLFGENMPPMTLKATNGKYLLLSGKELDDQTLPAWKPILAQIQRFLAAEYVLISSPMWNFGMPYVLKHYFDAIVQPRYLFHYTEKGPEGLATGKKVVVVTSRGGDYSEAPGKSMDQLEPSLRVMLGFIGIPDPTFINAQPMLASGPDAAQKIIDQAIATARRLIF